MFTYLYGQVPAGQAKSVFFPIVPASLGMIDLTVKAQSTLAADGVRRQLLVEVQTLSSHFQFCCTFQILSKNKQFSFKSCITECVLALL